MGPNRPKRRATCTLRRRFAPEAVRPCASGTWQSPRSREHRKVAIRNAIAGVDPDRGQSHQSKPPTPQPRSCPFPRSIDAPARSPLVWTARPLRKPRPDLPRVQSEIAALIDARLAIRVRGLPPSRLCGDLLAVRLGAEAGVSDRAGVTRRRPAWLCVSRRESTRNREALSQPRSNGRCSHPDSQARFHGRPSADIDRAGDLLLIRGFGLRVPGGALSKAQGRPDRRSSPGLDLLSGSEPSVQPQRFSITRIVVAPRVYGGALDLWRDLCVGVHRERDLCMAEGLHRGSRGCARS